MVNILCFFLFNILCLFWLIFYAFLAYILFFLAYILCFSGLYSVFSGLMFYAFPGLYSKFNDICSKLSLWSDFS